MAPVVLKRQNMMVDNKPVVIGLILGSVILTVCVLWIVIRDIVKKRAMTKSHMGKIQTSDISRPRTAHRHNDSLLNIISGSGAYLRVNTNPSPIATPSQVYFSPISPQTPARDLYLYADGDRLSTISSSEIHAPMPPPPYTSKVQSPAAIASQDGEGNQQVTVRKVLQPFDGLFHDELSVRAGDTVTVNKTYTDGWCVVGRLNSTYETAVGVVPLWCFQEPTGYRPQRPTRSKSLRKERKFSHPWLRR